MYTVDHTVNVGVGRSTSLVRETCMNEKKVKFSHTRYRALGPELILVYRQTAGTWLFKSSPETAAITATSPAVTFLHQKQQHQCIIYCMHCRSLVSLVRDSSSSTVSWFSVSIYSALGSYLCSFTTRQTPFCGWFIASYSTDRRLVSVWRRCYDLPDTCNAVAQWICNCLLFSPVNHWLS